MWVPEEAMPGLKVLDMGKIMLIVVLVQKVVLVDGLIELPVDPK